MATSNCVDYVAMRLDPADMTMTMKIPTTIFDCDTDLTAEQLAAVDAAVVADADGYKWSMLPLETGYLNKMFTFTADQNGDPIRDAGGNVIQGTKGSILFVHSATESCLTWLTSTQDDSKASIPQRYFDEGYNVYLACRRGTPYSREAVGIDLSTPAGYKDYMDYNT